MKRLHKAACTILPLSAQYQHKCQTSDRIPHLVNRLCRKPKKNPQISSPQNIHFINQSIWTGQYFASLHDFTVHIVIMILTKEDWRPDSAVEWPSLWVVQWIETCHVGVRWQQRQSLLGCHWLQPAALHQSLTLVAVCSFAEAETYLGLLSTNQTQVLQYCMQCMSLIKKTLTSLTL